MLRLPLEIENTTTSVGNADRSRLRRSNYGEVTTTYVQEVMLPGGKLVLVPGEKKISHEVKNLVNTTGSSSTPHESIALETSPKSRSSMWATVGKFLTNFSCCRLGSGQQDNKDSINFPNIFAEGKENPCVSVFNGRSGNYLNTKVTADLVVHTEGVEMNNSLVNSQASRLESRREEIFKNVI